MRRIAIVALAVVVLYGGHTILDLTPWGAAHGESYFVDPTAYTRAVDDFLDGFAPGFGVRQAST